MARFCTMVLIACTVINNAFAETWITHNNHIWRVRKTTTCHAVGSGDTKAVCDCCLIKHTHAFKKDPFIAVQHCTSEHNCRFDSEAYQNRQNAQNAVNKAKKNLRAMSIVNIDKLSHKPPLPEEGVLTEAHVMDILRSLSAQGFINLPFDIDEALKVKVLGDGAKGFWSGQLFAIRYQEKDPTSQTTSLRPLYILKETKKGVREIGHLYQVATSPLSAEKVPTIELLNHPIEDVSMARISFDDLHFKLKTNGSTRYFSLLQTAPGQSLHNYLRDFGKIAKSYNLEDPEFQAGITKMKHIFYRIGSAVSMLHQKYALDTNNRAFAARKTYVHGDMHSENIFFDDNSDMVTMIDNETFALSIDHPISGINDLVEFYMVHTIHTVAQKFSDQLTINTEFGIDDRTWHELCRSLFNGYLAAYGDLTREEYQQLYDDFRSRFFKGYSHRSLFTSFRNIKDQRKLKRLGPSSRRRHIEHEELTQTFDKLYEEGLQKYKK